MKTLKLVSDFDGIWTNQDDEAKYVSKYYLRKLRHISNKSEEQVTMLLNKVKAEMNKSPWEYGWYYKGGLGCFYGEDPYGDNNAVFDFIEKKCGSSENDSFVNELRELRNNIFEAGHESLDKFATALFFESTTMYKNDGRLNPHPDAKATAEKLLEQGVNIVVASNSKTEKIEFLFSKMGYPPEENGKVRARGNSMKFSVDKSFTELPEHLTLTANYKVSLRRPMYYTVLAEEKPDFVIGDVFSLDLALPLYLRLNDNTFSNLRVIQRLQPYTPQWVRDYLGRKEFEGIAFTINELRELPGVIASV